MCFLNQYFSVYFLFILILVIKQQIWLLDKCKILLRICGPHGRSLSSAVGPAYKRVKHIDVKYLSVREQQEIGTIKMKQIRTEEKTADIFTKPLTRRKFVKMKTKMGI